MIKMLDLKYIHLDFCMKYVRIILDHRLGVSILFKMNKCKQAKLNQLFLFKINKLSFTKFLETLITSHFAFILHVSCNVDLICL